MIGGLGAFILHLRGDGNLSRINGTLYICHSGCNCVMRPAQLLILSLALLNKSLSRQAWCRRGRRARRSGAGRWQSVGKHQAHRRSRQEFSGHYEGWDNLQKCAAQVSTVPVRRIIAPKKVPWSPAKIGTPGTGAGFLAHLKRRRYCYTAKRRQKRR